MARTTAGRHLCRAGELEVLLPARNLHPHFDRPHDSAGVVHPALIGLVLAAVVLLLGWAQPVTAAPNIRVAVVEGVRTVEIGGGPMMVGDTAGRLLSSETPTWIRATQRHGAIEVLGRSAAAV